MSIQALGGLQAAGGTDWTSGAMPGDFARTLTDVAAQDPAAPEVGLSLQRVLGALEHVNGEFTDLAASAAAAEASGQPMSPGEMVMLTTRCQEFMFDCELTSTVANRSSDGLQQLFSQQG